ncbi:MAG TPA: 4-(cytidine 5'-diphospho)-2-C-methyl-D-erythritol kinase [Nitrospiraceae bacterium]|jgi:4-diphosphocytidyl-2-C-methyl-D-erythritol kinase|nr:4-(cytidine 5'-diphospho)-2-C-methyl-D-erythritol kinase [Nitrospiraceae bacterium]
MANEQEVRVLAPAKVNLILRVLDRRPDGYHNLWSLMQTVELEDELRLRLRPDGTGVVLTCDDTTLPTDGRNLAARAAALVLERAGPPASRKTGVEIEMVKRIPVSAGLGGGSSDAAATIVGLSRLLGLNWSAGEMAKLSEPLGSDVPFFFHAPTAVVSGRGDHVTPMTLTGTRWVVIVNPGFPIETKWAYERLSAARNTVHPLAEGLVKLTVKPSLSWGDIIPLMENDFEAPLAPAHAVLGAIKAELVAQGAEAALLSGSGATVFGVFKDEDSATAARRVLSRMPGRRVYAVRAGAGPIACAEPVRSSGHHPLRVG